MKKTMIWSVIVLGITGIGLTWNPSANWLDGQWMSCAEARLGRPATPVSYAGVARRTTVRVATPGAGARGVGVTPGRGAGAPGVGVAPGNAGGPVNRVGVR